jgi:D-alanyl-D-alanine carboxypeptidase
MKRRYLSKRVASTLCAAGVLAFTTACGDTAARAPVGKQEVKIQRALDQLTAAGAPGAIMLVRNGDQTLRLTSGYGNLEKKTPMRPTDRFRIGSVTKTFVATIALQLVGENKLALDDTVERRLPGLVPNGKRITVRELLNHTSGLFDYTGDARFAETSLRNRTDAWSPREVVRVATSHGPVFVPGSEWSYSNTDYVVLGLIVEAASGHQIGTELRNRIFEPLNLHGTSFDSSPRISGQYAHGYSTLTGPRQDVSVFDPSGAWAAGAIVSTADDLASFYRALLRGRLLPPDLLKTMETTIPVPADPSGGGSGLGLFATGTRCGRIWGHDGIYFGYKTTAYSSRDGKRQIIVMVNEAPLSDQAASALQRVFKTAYCPGDESAS